MSDRLARLTDDMNELERELDLVRLELRQAVRGPGGSWDHPDAARLKRTCWNWSRNGALPPWPCARRKRSDMNRIKQHIDSLRFQRAQRRRAIAAAVNIADQIDRDRFVEAQQMMLRGLDIELNRLGYRPPPVIRLDAPPPRVPSRSPVVKHFDFAVTLRSLDSEQRVIEGIATTPAPDHLHDIIEPMGARYELPLPLLLGHDHQSPVGEVFAAKPSSTGIAVTAKIAKVDTPGAVKDLVDRAWDLVRHRLIKGLSIGFRPLKAEPLENGRGMRFLEYRWLELSLVVVPAQPQARITAHA